MGRVSGLRQTSLKPDMPTRSTTVRFPVADDPAALSPGSHDLVVLAVKSQDTGGALAAWEVASLRKANKKIGDGGVADTSCDEGVAATLPALHAATLNPCCTFRLQFYLNCPSAS